MMSDKKGKKVTGPGVSDPQGPAGVGGTVPAPPRSLSDDGLPPRFPESLGGELAISEVARGSAPSRAKAKERGKPGGSSGGSHSSERDPALPGPSRDPDLPGPSRVQSSADVFKRPGPKTFKERVRRAAEEDSASAMEFSGESSLEEWSEGDDLAYFAGLPSGKKGAVAQGATKKKGRGRNPSTGEWVGVAAVRQELAEARRELEAVTAERDALAGRVDVQFGATAGGVPSADDMYEGIKEDTNVSVFDSALEALGAIETVAERSGNLKGTLKKLLRVSARRSVAAIKLFFYRVTLRDTGYEEREELDQARRELRASMDLVEEAETKIRKLKEEVKILKAKETLRASEAERSSPPPVHRARSSKPSVVEVMEVEEFPPGGPSVTDPPPVGVTIDEGSPGTSALSVDVVERIVERVLGKLRPPASVPVPPPEAPAPLPQEGESWSRVVGRKAGRKKKATKSSTKEAPPPPPPNIERGGTKKKKAPPKQGGKSGGQKVPPKKKVLGIAREPRTAAVLVSVVPGGGISMAEALTRARPVVAGNLGSAPNTIKRARAGGLLIQFSGAEGRQHADGLASALRQVIGNDKGVRVARPQKRAELRLEGLDDSITRGELLESVAGIAGCLAEDLEMGEIKSLPQGLGSVWVRCPVAVSNKLVEEGKWRIGFTTVRVKPLPVRPMRCFRCLEVGHTGALCKGVDRSGRCHRCGDRSHISKGCTAVPKCPLCSEFGLPAGHSLGAAACVSGKRAAGRKLAALKAKEAKEVSGKKKGESPASVRPPPSDLISGDEGVGGTASGEMPPPKDPPPGPSSGGAGMSSPATKGPRELGGGRTARTSLKRSASQRSPSKSTTVSGEAAAETTPPPLSHVKKKRSRGGRFKTR